ncbi:hypothetical protein HXA34_10905 [Salipaludibacillus agaradhaerens]|uniref:hypothetical protein n=1 Tax=Salipaludibacillus agaradhaerens TaxID=76935 RepID=UPI002150A791|nr:hypothetical protein [Salipaludibacillus agaradhaerens]MCR6106796.1 hypothetical protein [Salipaludibacillus agaradhaerens]MCR6118828.1 hypothetical protein [Salipaludibacillus agaradhaerens]
MDKQEKEMAPYKDRDRYFLDVDRMINEGLGGGTVNNKENSGIIEEARELGKESPPQTNRQDDDTNK